MKQCIRSEPGGRRLQTFIEAKFPPNIRAIHLNNHRVLWVMRDGGLGQEVVGIWAGSGRPQAEFLKSTGWPIGLITCLSIEGLEWLEPGVAYWTILDWEI